MHRTHTVPYGTHTEVFTRTIQNKSKNMIRCARCLNTLHVSRRTIKNSPPKCSNERNQNNGVFSAFQTSRLLPNACAERERRGRRKRSAAPHKFCVSILNDSQPPPRAAAAPCSTLLLPSRLKPNRHCSSHAARSGMGRQLQLTAGYDDTPPAELSMTVGEHEQHLCSPGDPATAPLPTPFPFLRDHSRTHLQRTHLQFPGCTMIAFPPHQRTKSPEPPPKGAPPFL